MADRRHYNQFLDPDFRESTVSSRTINRWRADKRKRETDAEESETAISQDPVAGVTTPAEDEVTDTGPEILQDTKSCSDDSAEDKFVEISQAGAGSADSDNLAVQECRDGKSTQNVDRNSHSDDKEQSSTEDGEDQPASTEDNEEQRSTDEDSIIMFERSNLSTAAVSAMIVAFTLRFGISYQAQGALIELVKTLAGDEYKNVRMNNYFLRQHYDPPVDKVKLNFYCESCSKMLHQTNPQRMKKITVICEACDKGYTLSTMSSNFFFSIDIRYQLEMLFKDIKLQTSLLEVLNKIQSFDGSDNVRDVCDGSIYKKAITEISANRTITFNFNTDGTPLFRSSKRSLWPIQLMINELPPNVRGKNLISAGMWISTKEPKPQFMNLYLTSFVEQVNDLSTRGISLRTVGGQKILVKAVPLCASVDSVARPILQNRIQFNGYDGCSWCYIHGKYVNNLVRQTFVEADVDNRTHDSHLKDIEEAISRRTVFRGVKGQSILTTLLLFDMIWGFPVDYLHAVLLGVIQLLWELWTRPGQQFFLKPSQRTIINERLNSISPPHDVHRLPRDLNEKAKWKGSEWRSWLLFYSLPCLNGILDNKALQHLTLLVNSIFKLLKQNITAKELKDCEYDLSKFVFDFEILYGEGCMTFNVHSLLHLVESVKQTGPLWSTSTFAFESNMNGLKRNVNGPKGVGQQIINRMLTTNNFRWSTLSSHWKSHTAVEYCTNLLSSNPPQKYSSSENVGEVTFLGDGIESENIFAEDIDSLSSKIRIYARCIYKKRIYSIKSYSCDKRNDDSLALLKSGQIIRLKNIICSNQQCYLQVQEYSQSVFYKTVHISEIKIESSTRIIPISELQDKCVLIDLKSENLIYACVMPNTIEVQ